MRSMRSASAVEWGLEGNKTVFVEVVVLYTGAGRSLEYQDAVCA